MGSESLMAHRRQVDAPKYRGRAARCQVSYHDGAVWIFVRTFHQNKGRVRLSSLLFLKGKTMRKRIYEVIEVSDGRDIYSKIYDIIMMVSIFVSLIPLAFKYDNLLFQVIDKVCVTIFILDYLLRFMTADFKYKRKRVSSFIRYPFSPMALIDLISILPSLIVVDSSLKLFRIVRMLRALRVFRVFKATRYSKNLQIISRVLKKSKAPLLAVCTLAVGYVFVSALVIINVEPESFESFFDAIYWATVSLTTMGYGDIYPVTTTGRAVTMISSFFGIAIVALPAGIITAGYMREIENNSVDASNDDSNNGDNTAK